MENLQKSFHIAANISNSLKLLISSDQSQEFQRELHLNLSKKVDSLKDLLSGCLSHMKGSYQIMDNLLKERDALLARKTMEGEENQSLSIFAEGTSNMFNRSSNRLFSKNKNINRNMTSSDQNLFGYNNNSLTQQLKVIMKELQAEGESKSSNLNLESVLKFTAVSMHVLNSIESNSQRIEALVSQLNDVSMNGGELEVNKNSPKKRGNSRVRSKSSQKSKKKSKLNHSRKVQFEKFARKL